MFETNVLQKHGRHILWWIQSSLNLLGFKTSKQKGASTPQFWHYGYVL